MSKILDEGKIVVERDVVKYQVLETRMEACPIALDLRRFSRNQETREFEPLNDNRFDSTLYFDDDGKIIDRAPATGSVSARDLQEMYGQKLKSYLASSMKLVQGRAVAHSTRQELSDRISGFFQGEEGIKRDQGYLPGGKQFIRADL